MNIFIFFYIFSNNSELSIVNEFYSSLSSGKHIQNIILKHFLIIFYRLTFLKFLIKILKIYIDYGMEMIVFRDSDLYAIISYLKIKPSFLLKIKKIFIEESIKQEFLWLIEKNFQYVFKNLIFIFYSRKDLLRLTYPSFSELNMISIWSEDITSAKALAIMLQVRNTI